METINCVFRILWNLDQEQKKSVWNAHQQAKRFVEPLCRYDNASSPRKWTSYLWSNLCVGPRIFQKQKRRTIIDSLQQSCCFAQSFPLTSSVSTELNNSQIIRFFSTKWRTSRSLEISPNVLSISAKPPSISVPDNRFGKLPEDIQVSQSSKRRCWIDDKDFSWTTCHDSPLYGFEWIRTCWIIPRMYVISKWWNIHSENMDSRRYENWPSIGSQCHVSLVWMWYWNRSYIPEEWWISIVDCDQQAYEQTSTSFVKRMGHLFTTKKWPPVRRDPLRQNRENNRLHNYLHSRRC